MSEPIKKQKGFIPHFEMKDESYGINITKELWDTIMPNIDSINNVRLIIILGTGGHNESS